MKDVARQIRSIVTTVEPQLAGMADDDVRVKPAADEWSKKEILGHLIDSAANNHQRFVRAAIDDAATFPTYDQNKWVGMQRCNDRPWRSLVALWSAYNFHLCHIIECIPEAAASAPCNIGQDEPARLDFVVQDYLRHLRLHLTDILDEPI